MSFLSNRFFAVLVSSAFVVSAAAQTHTNPQINVRPQTRVVNKVDNSKVVQLAHTHPAIADNAVDNGRVASSTPTGNLMLVLKGSDVQEAALHSLLDEQQDRGSANFHQWMTPETFGAAFGVASSDIAQVTAWLQDQGFTVASVSKGGRVIQFSGNTGQVEKAFHTEMHHITVNGESHVANTVDLSVPEALAPVMVGIASLSDFHAKSTGIVNPRKLVLGTDGQMHPVIPGTNSPDYTSLSTGSHYVGPGDFATIYNAKPLLASGIDGTGVTIGVIGQTSISLSNVETFRSMFFLPDNDPQIINVGPAPAIISDDIESDLDVEWAGALATKAKVKFYTAGLGGGYYDDGIDVSALFAVDTNVADIITLSYGGCEFSNGATGTGYFNGLWEQAAAQGQTVFVSTGDSSATGCASSSAALANSATSKRYGVNALGSSAYNVAVGGSEFNEGTTTGVTSYWGPGGVQPYGTALSYIPETVWSEGAFDIVAAATGVAGGGGGMAQFTARPAWQVATGISPTADPVGPVIDSTGAVPATQLHRLVPDVALIAAGGHDGTIFCSEGVCKLNADGTIAGIGVVGGTSVATPTMAGVQALINQKNGGRQGNANYFYYKLAAAVPVANCASTLPPAATCNFNDIVTGDNYSPVTATGKYSFTTSSIQGVLGTDYLGFPATTGFDEATGLGTPNVTNLANNWNTVTFNASKTTLNLSPTSITHGASQTAVITVAAVSGSGTPTGDVSITAVGQSAGASDGNYYKLAAGTVTVTLKNLPGGTYNVVAHYSGDSVYGASDSAPVQVTIAKEASATFLSVESAPTSGAQPPVVTSMAYGTSAYLVTFVQGASATAVNGNNILNTGVPSGNITYTLQLGTTTLPTYIAPLDAYGTAYLEAGPAVGGILLPSTYPTLAVGSYTATVSYPGDNSFGASSATGTFTVTKASVNPAIRVLTADIAAGATATFNVTVAASGAGVLPTGTITLTDTTTSTTLGTGTLVNGAALMSTTAITTAGAHTIVAAYSGDGNYNATNSANATVTVTGAASTVTLTPSLTTAPVLTSIALATTVPATATGTVTFYDQSIYLGSVTISNTTHLAPNLNLATLTAGVHTITAVFSGNATLAAATSAAATVTITQNQPTLALSSQQQTSNSLTFNMNGVLTLVPSVATPVPFPSGSINFLDGTTVLGSAAPVKTLNYGFFTAAFTAAALTKPGIHTLTAVYPGDTNYAAATSNTQTVSIGLTTTALTVSATNVGTGTPFTLTAKVTPIVPNTPAVGGTVTFTDTTTAATLGTATVVAGTATLTTNVTALGTHVITAVYSGDANYYTSNATSSVSLTAITPGFTIAANPTSLTITRGNMGVIALSATTFGNYAGTGLTTITGLPANASYIITNSPYVFNGVNGTQTFNVYITTFAPHAAVKPASFLWLPALMLAGLLGLRRKQLTLRGRQLIVFAILMLGMMSATGCGSNGSFPGTATGTSTATITMVGTGSTSASPNMTATATVSVTVQ